MTSGEVIFNNVEEIVHFVNQAEKSAGMWESVWEAVLWMENPFWGL